MLELLVHHVTSRLEKVNLLPTLSTDEIEGGRGYQYASLTRQQHGTVNCGLAGDRGTL
jgi:hypothetical protein